MKFVVCNLCGRDDTTVVNQGPDLHLGIPGPFKLVKCRHCGLVYQNPQLEPDELAQHYPDEYMAYQSPDVKQSALERTSKNHAVARFCDRVTRRHPENGRILDIGCATGEFLHGMQLRGWDVVGVEPSSYAATVARTQYHLELQVGTLEGTNFPDDTFDVVAMWDVFEHVADPRATLLEIRRILKPGGLLVASIPNIDSIESKIFKAYWLGWDRPRHLYLYSQKVLKQYFHETGFDWAGVESFNGRLHVTLMSINYWLTARNVSAATQQKLIEKVYNLPLRLLTLPLYKFAEILNKTTVMTVFAIANNA